MKIEKNQDQSLIKKEYVEETIRHYEKQGFTVLSRNEFYLIMKASFIDKICKVDLKTRLITWV